MAASLLKKMSAKAIVGNVKEVAKSIEHDGDKTPLYNVYGICTGIETGEHQTNGPWIGFKGSFGAINLVTGEEFSATKCFLPDPMPGLLENAMRDNDSVEFALEVALKRRDDLAVGYEYMVTPLIDAQEADPLAHLKAKALPKASVQQLDAPKAEAAETKPAAKKKTA